MKVSVALCTYNGEQFLQQQLQSIFDQTVRIDELIIGDDGSTDGTINIINNYQNQYPGIITLYVNEVRLGSRKNFEKACRLITGKVVFLADQDDVWHINKVEEIMNVFYENISVAAIFTEADLIDHKGIKSGKSLLGVAGFPPAGINKADYFYHIVAHGNMAAGTTMAFRSILLNLGLPFGCQDILWHDEWVALVAAHQNGLYFLDKALMDYRIHPGQQLGIGYDHIMAQRARFRTAGFTPVTRQEAIAYFQHWLNAGRRAMRLANHFARMPLYNAAIQTEFRSARKLMLACYPFIIRKLKQVKLFFKHTAYLLIFLVLLA